MKSFKIKGTETFPNIILDPENNVFEITGRSVPTNGKEFYEPVIDWMEGYAANPNASTTVLFNLEFFNISSSKMILFILYKLNEIKLAGHTVKIKWTYAEEDDDMHEVGEDYAYMVDVPFEFVMDNTRVKEKGISF